MSGQKGAAGKAAPRPRRRNAHQSRTARAKKTNLYSDPLVIAWVGDRLSDGMRHKDIIEASKNGLYAWPRPGAALSSGTLTPITRRIRGGDIPASTPRSVRKARVDEQQTRMEEIAAGLQIKSQALSDMAEINKLLGAVMVRLHNLDLTVLNGIKDKTVQQFINTCFNNLVDGQECIGTKLSEYQARADEQAVRERIAIMRNPAGRTAPEIENANAIADRLERGLGDGLKLTAG